MKLRFKSNNNFKVTNPSAFAHQLALDLNSIGVLKFLVNEVTGENIEKNFDISTVQKHDPNNPSEIIECSLVFSTNLEISPGVETAIKAFFKNKNLEVVLDDG